MEDGGLNPPLHADESRQDPFGFAQGRCRRDERNEDFTAEDAEDSHRRIKKEKARRKQEKDAGGPAPALREKLLDQRMNLLESGQRKATMANGLSGLHRAPEGI